MLLLIVEHRSCLRPGMDLCLDARVSFVVFAHSDRNCRYGDRQFSNTQSISLEMQAFDVVTIASNQDIVNRETWMLLHT